MNGFINLSASYSSTFNDILPGVVEHDFVVVVVAYYFYHWVGKFISQKFLKEVKYLSTLNLIEDPVYLQICPLIDKHWAVVAS